MARFCYRRGKFDVNPLNFSAFYCIAHFMEMNESVSNTPNLVEQTEKSLEEIRYWTWSEIILALRQCQDLEPVASTSGILSKYFDSLCGRIAASCAEPSPCPSSSSPDSSGFRLSCDTRSTESLKNNSFRATSTWWFEDFVALEPHWIEMLIKSMESKNVDHGIISRFLFYYHKSSFATATTDAKCKLTEAVVQMLQSLDLSLVSFKSLLGMLRVSSNLNISKCCRNQLEIMIGSLLDQATLDNLLIPSPAGTKYLYDVNLVLRLLNSFIGKEACCVALTRLRKVATLMDLYIAEVAPDPSLKPSKLLALIRALPDSARLSYDGIYGAIDIYLEVHSGLSEEEKMRVCGGLNYEKLSAETCNHLTKNRKFPSKAAAEALISQKSKLKSLLHETNQPNSYKPSPSSLVGSKGKAKKDESCQQIVLYAGKLDISTENQRLRAHLQGMQWRVLELEKVCRKMQVQMTKMMRSRLSSQNNAKSLPRLCS
ncbi:OLC1v1025088C2 [Oldenlandia corymbosa var. corymbosa]|nr:OLC1v1025088C2 [Oldenlandia corymbosa var. corymbosa]